MTKRRILCALIALWALCFHSPDPCQAQDSARAQSGPDQLAPTPWTFAASGDSRNCGDVVMPAIAAGVKHRRVSFYWHLGDFRRISEPDEDIQHEFGRVAAPLTRPEYEALAWKDFLTRQIEPFAPVPVYLARGNHEVIPPKTTAEYLAQFRPWLDAPSLRAQRLRDYAADLEPKTYYHWIERGVDFIVLDNAWNYEFGPDQIAWIEKVLRDDSVNPAVITVVVGMHEALPESISKGHSMNESQAGVESGRRVYADLLDAQNKSHKHVYVLSSHSHYFMDGIFKTDYWRENGGVLPGWIVGTAGAQRYALPEGWENANAAQTNVYGFLLGTVGESGQIQFDFQRVNEQDVPESVRERYAPEFVHWCFAGNSKAR